MPVQFNSTDYFAPAGPTVALVATTVSSYAAVTSLVPVQRYYITNTGTTPVQVRFHVNTSSGVAVLATPGSPTYGPVLGAGDDFTCALPQEEQGQLPNGFTTSAVISVISPSGSNNVYITPMMGQ
jgi:hypothetical protein